MNKVIHCSEAIMCYQLSYRTLLFQQELAPLTLLLCTMLLYMLLLHQ